MNIDWSKAPVGYPIWLEDIRPHREGSDRSGWAREGKGEYDFPGGGFWSFSMRGVQYIAHKNPEWTGEGRPPAGTVCEHRTGHGMAWSTATVLAYGEKKVFYRDRDGHEWTRLYDEIEFRPIRTPEQIAAEEREKAAYELASHVAGYMGKSEPNPDAIKIAGYLYDQGYRKQVTS